METFLAVSMGTAFVVASVAALVAAIIMTVSAFRTSRRCTQTEINVLFVCMVLVFVGCALFTGLVLSVTKN